MSRPPLPTGNFKRSPTAAGFGTKTRNQNSMRSRTVPYPHGYPELHRLDPSHWGGEGQWFFCSSAHGADPSLLKNTEHRIADCPRVPARLIREFLNRPTQRAAHQLVG